MARQETYRLWTPIANSLDVYRRRLIADRNAVYEHTWRLLHIEESLVVTLGAAVASRLYDIWNRDGQKLAELNNLRQLVTGIPTGDGADGEIVEKSCLDGRIDAWIDLLMRYTKPESLPDCSFCKAASSYLVEEIDGRIAFVDGWQRIAPVPELFKEPKTSRVQRLRAINTFRNKLAHVPVSHKVMPDVYRGLRQEIVRLLCSDQDVLTKSEYSDFVYTKWLDPLKGKLANKHGFVTGSDFRQHDWDRPQNRFDGHCDAWFEWCDGSCEPLAWDGTPFVELDEELKATLLFRVDELAAQPQQDEFNAEYHRFAAEIDPVQRRPLPQDRISRWIPERPAAPAITQQTVAQSIATTPLSDEPVTVEPVDANVNVSVVAPSVVASVTATDDVAVQVVGQPPTAMSAAQLRQVAEEGYRSRDNEKACQMFEELANRGDAERYNHVSKLKHGISIRHLADAADDETTKIDLLQRAVNLLDQAADHAIASYSAQALYEQSKALWRLWRTKHDQAFLNDALSAANRATLMVYDPSYLSWFERLKAELHGLSTPTPS